MHAEKLDNFSKLIELLREKVCTYIYIGGKEFKLIIFPQ